MCRAIEPAIAHNRYQELRYSYISSPEPIIYPLYQIQLKLIVIKIILRDRGRTAALSVKEYDFKNIEFKYSCLINKNIYN